MQMGVREEDNIVYHTLHKQKKFISQQVNSLKLNRPGAKLIINILNKLKNSVECIELLL